MAARLSRASSRPAGEKGSSSSPPTTRATSSGPTRSSNWGSDGLEPPPVPQSPTPPVRNRRGDGETGRRGDSIDELSLTRVGHLRQGRGAGASPAYRDRLDLLFRGDRCHAGFVRDRAVWIARRGQGQGLFGAALDHSLLLCRDGAPARLRPRGGDRHRLRAPEGCSGLAHSRRQDPLQLPPLPGDRRGHAAGLLDPSRMAPGFARRYDRSPRPRGLRSRRRLDVPGGARRPRVAEERPVRGDLFPAPPASASLSHRGDRGGRGRIPALNTAPRHRGLRPRGHLRRLSSGQRGMGRLGRHGDGALRLSLSPRPPVALSGADGGSGGRGDGGNAMKVLKWLLLPYMTAIVIGAFLWPAPAQGFIGESSRIFFFHVPCAWTSALASLVAAGYSVPYLARRNPRHDDVAAGAVRLGLLFAVLALVTGALFAKIMWGAYWNWDPRESSFLLLIFLYAAYLFLRAAVEDPERRARMSAAYALFAAVLMPFLFFVAPRVPSSLHPQTVINPQGKILMDTPTKAVFFGAMVGFTGLFFWMLSLESRAARLQRTVDSS